MSHLPTPPQVREAALARVRELCLALPETTERSVAPKSLVAQLPPR